MDRKTEAEHFISAEKKLQLIHQIRKEHQQNQNAVRGREAFLYGNTPYISFQESEPKDTARPQIQGSGFPIRVAAAFLLFGIFYAATVKDTPVFGILPAKIYEMVEKDYSPILFDFIGEIPYTLHE